MRYRVFILLLIGFLTACKKDDPGTVQGPTPYALEIPSLFSEKLIAPVLPANNPLTEEGVALGEKLFFDKRLSLDGNISCASCHLPQQAFSDRRAVSLGIRRQEGERNAMPIFNLAWNYDDRFNWDGKALSLEAQAFRPVTHPKEMGNTWVNVARTLQEDTVYPNLFEQAFGFCKIDSVVITKALAQFERTLISAQAPFDQFLLGQRNLTPRQENGLAIFMDEDRGDCFHCHGSENNPLWTDNDFHNNGLDTDFADLGLGAITGDPADNGKFRTPSLRNLTRTAPYMHDGRFQTLEEVVNHYSEGLKPSATIDPLMKKVNQGGVQLTSQDKADLIAFLRSLSDPNFGQGIGPGD